MLVLAIIAIVSIAMNIGFILGLIITTMDIEPKMTYEEWVKMMEEENE